MPINADWEAVTQKEAHRGTVNRNQHNHTLKHLLHTRIVDAKYTHQRAHPHTERNRARERVAYKVSTNLCAGCCCGMQQAAVGNAHTQANRWTIAIMYNHCLPPPAAHLRPGRRAVLLPGRQFRCDVSVFIIDFHFSFLLFFVPSPCFVQCLFLSRLCSVLFSSFFFFLIPSNCSIQGVSHILVSIVSVVSVVSVVSIVSIVSIVFPYFLLPTKLETKNQILPPKKLQETKN